VDYRVPLASERYRVRLAADLFNIFNRRTATEIDHCQAKCVQ